MTSPPPFATNMFLLCIIHPSLTSCRRATDILIRTLSTSYHIPPAHRGPHVFLDPIPQAVCALHICVRSRSLELFISDIFRPNPHPKGAKRAQEVSPTILVDLHGLLGSERRVHAE